MASEPSAADFECDDPDCAVCNDHVTELREAVMFADFPPEDLGFVRAGVDDEGRQLWRIFDESDFAVEFEAVGGDAGMLTRIATALGAQPDEFFELFAADEAASVDSEELDG